MNYQQYFDCRVKVQPVYDYNMRRTNGDKASDIAKGLTVMAGEAFLHPTNPVKFKIEVNDPVFFNKRLTADRDGYS